MRRTVGSAIPAMLGRDLSAATVLRFKTALIVSCELWEPRYSIIRIGSDEGDNSPEKMRSGELHLDIRGEYRPRGHLGDFTTDVMERNMVISRRANGAIEVLQ